MAKHGGQIEESLRRLESESQSRMFIGIPMVSREPAPHGSGRSVRSPVRITHSSSDGHDASVYQAEMAPRRAEAGRFKRGSWPRERGRSPQDIASLCSRFSLRCQLCALSLIRDATAGNVPRGEPDDGRSQNCASSHVVAVPTCDVRVQAAEKHGVSSLFSH